MTAAGPDVICCPKCRSALRLAADGSSSCTSCGAVYGSCDGIPDLVVGRGTVDAPRRGLGPLHRIAANARVYDLIQRAAGREHIKARIAPYLADTDQATVLDVGAGTGTLAQLLHGSARYVWLDSDPKKLRGFAAVAGEREAVLSNGLRMGIRSNSIDVALCSAVSHHLDDDALRELSSELKRVVRGRMLFLDAVRTPSPAARALWWLDRGSYPRTADHLLAALEADFLFDHVDRFSVLHDYVFAIAHPRELSA
jgi:SAM-dependent methyltransferase